MFIMLSEHISKPRDCDPEDGKKNNKINKFKIPGFSRHI